MEPGHYNKQISNEVFKIQESARIKENELKLYDHIIRKFIATIVRLMIDCNRNVSLSTLAGSEAYWLVFLFKNLNHFIE